MTRVLMFCSQFRPIVGGAELQAERLSHALIERGCDVAVLTPLFDPSWPTTEITDRLRVWRFALTDLSRTVPFARGLGIPNSLIQWRQTRRAVLQHIDAYDVLHTHIASPLAAFAMEAAHSRGKPVLCKLAGGAQGFDFSFLRGTSLLGPWIARALRSRMDAWVAVSEEIRGVLLAEGVAGERIHFIPNGVDTEHTVWSAPVEPIRRFLCLGQLWKFDFPTLLAAFDRLLESVPDAELRIVGGGDLLRVREQLAPRLRASGRTEILGYSPGETQLRWAHALVHFSRMEGLSNVLLEAMACGRPCIASGIGANQEVLDEGRAGMLVPIGDVDGLHAAMRRLCSHSAEALRFSRAARNRVESRYAMKLTVTRFLELYRDLIQPPSGGVTSGATGRRAVDVPTTPGT